MLKGNINLADKQLDKAVTIFGNYVEIPRSLQKRKRRADAFDLL